MARRVRVKSVWPEGVGSGSEIAAADGGGGGAAAAIVGFEKPL